jgi:hypothetical protein
MPNYCSVQIPICVLYCNAYIAACQCLIAACQCLIIAACQRQVIAACQCLIISACQCLLQLIIAGANALRSYICSSSVPRPLLVQFSDPLSVQFHDLCQFSLPVQCASSIPRPMPVQSCGLCQSSDLCQFRANCLKLLQSANAYCS